MTVAIAQLQIRQGLHRAPAGCDETRLRPLALPDQDDSGLPVDVSRTDGQHLGAPYAGVEHDHEDRPLEGRLDSAQQRAQLGRRQRRPRRGRGGRGERAQRKKDRSAEILVLTVEEAMPKRARSSAMWRATSSSSTSESAGTWTARENLSRWPR